VLRERRDVLTDAHVQGAPDLVVEVLSPGTRRTDEVTKRKLYERFGVKEYWVVDPELDTIKICRRTEQPGPEPVERAFTRVAELSLEDRAAAALTTPLFPGLSMPLTDIFAPPF
jgi:Uma2 family endonuclease